MADSQLVKLSKDIPKLRPYSAYVLDLQTRLASPTKHQLSLNKSFNFLKTPVRGSGNKILRSLSTGKQHFWYDSEEIRRMESGELAFSRLTRRVSSLLVVAHNFSLSTGVSRPVSHYLNALMAINPLLKLESIEYRPGKSSADILDREKNFDFIIINSLGSFIQNVDLVKHARRLNKKKYAVYLHETEYTFNKLRANDKALFGSIICLLQESSVFCVSKLQQHYLDHKLGIKRTKLVYNTTLLPYAESGKTSMPISTSSGNKKILMSGTVQNRKGVDLFSRVSDLAELQKLGYQFIWAGRDTGENTYKSNNVTWLGELPADDLAALLKTIDVFFLSSLDDPFPLSVVEAIQSGKRCVVYEKTGVCELFHGITSGPGTVFSTYSPEAALAAIVQVMSEHYDAERFRIITDMLSLKSYVSRLNLAIKATIRESCLPKADPKKKVILLCNGPSFKQVNQAMDLSNAIIVRMNHFYLEETRFGDGRVDYFFWGVNNFTLHEQIQRTLLTGSYRIVNYMCPVKQEDLELPEDMEPILRSADSYYDHWKIIASNSSLARTLMSRPLPTTGIQALAALCILGFREFHIAGMDFYSSDKINRYHYKVPRNIKDKMDEKHFTPSYEKGAHSLEKDTECLKLIFDEYPDLKVTAISNMPILERIAKNAGIKILNNAVYPLT